MQEKRDYLGLTFVRVRLRHSLTFTSPSYIDLFARSAYGYFVRHNTGLNIRTALEGLFKIKVNSTLVHSSAIFACYLNISLHSELQNHIKMSSWEGTYYMKEYFTRSRQLSSNTLTIL
jgi:hypothetical protein